MKVMISFVDRSNTLLEYPASKLQDLALVLLRVYVSWMFFPAGLLKLKDWDTTLFLFEEEYQVPILSPELAAYLGTGGELVLPILLVLGLLSRFAAVGLFFINIVAVISLASIAPAALSQHLLWGLALAVIVLWGGGRASLDSLSRVLFNTKITHSVSKC